MENVNIVEVKKISKMPSRQKKGRFWTKQTFEVRMVNRKLMLSVANGLWL